VSSCSELETRELDQEVSMRGMLLSIALVSVVAIAAPATRTATAMTTVPAMSAGTSPVYALQVPDKQIEITVNDRGSVRWYRNPVWITLAAFGGVIVLLLIILAVRGGGTTIIKE